MYQELELGQMTCVGEDSWRWRIKEPQSGDWEDRGPGTSVGPYEDQEGVDLQPSAPQRT